MVPNAGRSGLLHTLVDPFGYPVFDEVSRIKMYEGSNNASTKTVTITDPEINNDMNVISIGSSVANDKYTNITLNTGSCVITFSEAKMRTACFYVYRKEGGLL